MSLYILMVFFAVTGTDQNGWSLTLVLYARHHEYKAVIWYPHPWFRALQQHCLGSMAPR